MKPDILTFLRLSFGWYYCMIKTLALSVWYGTIFNGELIMGHEYQEQDDETLACKRCGDISK